MYVETFAQKLKFARERTGFTQREVAKEIGLPQSTIAKYETAKLEPSVETLGKLADFYGVSLDWLVGTRGEQEIYHPKKERLVITDKSLGIRKNQP